MTQPNLRGWPRLIVIDRHTLPGIAGLRWVACNCRGS